MASFWFTARFRMKTNTCFTPAQALEGLLDSTANVTFFGHTHHQGGFSYENQKSQLEMLSIHPRASESFAPLRIEAETQISAESWLDRPAARWRSARRIRDRRSRT